MFSTSNSSTLAGRSTPALAATTSSKSRKEWTGANVCSTVAKILFLPVVEHLVLLLVNNCHFHLKRSHMCLNDHVPNDV